MTDTNPWEFDKRGLNAVQRFFRPHAFRLGYLMATTLEGKATLRLMAPSRAVAEAAATDKGVVTLRCFMESMTMDVSTEIGKVREHGADWTYSIEVMDDRDPPDMELRATKRTG